MSRLDALQGLPLFLLLLIPLWGQAQQEAGFQGNFRIESAGVPGFLGLGMEARPVLVAGARELRLDEVWSLQKNPDGSFFLVCNENGRMLKVEHWLGLSVLRAAPYDESEAENFKWRLESADNGFFRIVSVVGGGALHVQQAARESPHPLGLSLGQEGQRWRLKPLRQEAGKGRGVVLFSEKRFRGKRRLFPLGAYSSTDFAPLENDRALSVAVPEGWQVVLFEHSFFRGRSLTLTESVEDLASLGFDRKVSSLLVQPHRPSRIGSDAPLPLEFLEARLRPAGSPRPLLATHSQLPCDCHIQGLSWSAETEHFVVTCQDRCPSKSGGYVLLFGEHSPMALDVERSRVPSRFNHPSATQVFHRHFPVAFSGKPGEDTFIEFYEIRGKHLRRRPRAGFQVPGRHYGALAYATVGPNTYLIGAGWDARTLTFWKAAGKNQIRGFREILHSRRPEDLLLPGLDRQWGPYNNLWLGELEDGRIVLIATHGGLTATKSWLDVWEVQNLGTPQVRLKKIAKMSLEAKARNGVNLFLEGVAVQMRGGRLADLRLWCAPHDFVANGCQPNRRCSQGIYPLLPLKW